MEESCGSRETDVTDGDEAEEWRDGGGTLDGENGLDTKDVSSWAWSWLICCKIANCCCLAWTAAEREMVGDGAVDGVFKSGDEVEEEERGEVVCTD